MARTTKKNIESSFTHFCDAFGFNKSQSWNDPGLGLDHNSSYGGYVIEERSGSSGGVGHPFGSSRMKANAFYDALWFATRAMEHSKK